MTKEFKRLLNEQREELIEQGYRELVDTMDYIESRIRSGEVSSLAEAVDVQDFPISEEETVIFLNGISFGVLLQKIFENDPAGMESSDPPEHLLRRWDEAAIQTILVPDNGELSVVGIEETKMITEGEKLECICDESFLDEQEALEHIS